MNTKNTNEDPRTEQALSNGQEQITGIDLALFFVESLRKSQVLAGVRSLPYAMVTFNPIQYIDIILADELGGKGGENLIKNCADADGKINPSKLLKKLISTYKRIVDTLLSDTYKNFFRSNTQFKPADLAAEYQKIFRYMAASYGVAEAFVDFANEYGVIENRTLSQSDKPKPPDAAKPAERARRTTMSWGDAPRHRKKRPKKEEVIPLINVGLSSSAGEMPERRPTQRIGFTGPSSTPPSSRRHTLKLVSSEDGKGIVAGYKEDAIKHSTLPPARRSSMPISAAMVEKVNMPRHETLPGIPFPLVSRLEEQSVESSAPKATRDPNQYWDNPPDEEDEAPRPSLHSFNPPPPISDVRGLVTDFEAALGAMKTLADQQFRRMFIREYRLLAMKNNVNENIDERFLDEAVKKVLTLADEVDTNDADAPCKDMRNFYFLQKITPEQRLSELRELARQAMAELPKMKAEANEEFVAEFTRTFESMYPIKGDKKRRDEMFMPVFNQTVREVNKTMKSTPDKFESYKLYYPSGHMFGIIPELAMKIASDEALAQLPRLPLAVEAYLKTNNRELIEQKVKETEPGDLEDLCRAINWWVLEWLYRALPKEAPKKPGERNYKAWLNYYFKTQSKPNKLRRENADEVLDVIATKTYSTVYDLCMEIRRKANLPVPESMTTETERADIGAILAETSADDRLKTNDGDEPLYLLVAEGNGASSGLTAAAPQLADLSTLADDENETAPVAEQTSQVLDMTGDVERLEVPAADQKAQGHVREFSNLADHFARNTNLPVSRGPMGSIPPESNQDGDVNAAAESDHMPAVSGEMIGRTVSGNAEMAAPQSINVNNDATEQPFIEQTADAPEKKKSWLRRHAGKIVAAAAVAASTLGGFYVNKTTQDFEKQSTPVSSATPTTRSTSDLKVASNAPSSSADVKTAPTTAPDPKTTSTPDKTADGILTVTPEMIASVKNPELKKIMFEGKFEVKANSGGYGQQIRAYFDAEINYRVINHQITPEQAKEMAAQLDKLQQEINFGAAVSYYERYGHMSYGEVNAKRANPGSDTLFSYLDRNGNNAGMGKWENWRSGYGGHAKMAGAQEAKKHFEEKYEQAMLTFTTNSEYKYDQRSAGNIHWGAQGGDKRLVQNEKGQWLPYFAECANIVLGGHEKSVDIDLDLEWTDEPANGTNSVPAVNPANSCEPEVSPLDGGAPDNGVIDGGNGGKTGLLNNRKETTDGDNSPRIEVTGYTESDDDMSIEVAWTDPEDPTIEMCEEVDIDLSELDEEPVAKTPAVKVTSSTLSPELEAELADLEDGWFTAETPVAAKAEAVKSSVNVSSSKLSASVEAELAEIEDGWFTETACLEVEKPEAIESTLEEKIADINKNMSSRRQSLLERGEVFVPSLSGDLNGSVMLAIKNGFLKQCYTDEQQDRVEAIVNKLRITHFAEYKVGEKGTYAKLSTEKLAELQRALGAAESIPEAQFQVRQEVAGSVNEILKAD